MGPLLSALSYIAGLVALICFIMVLVKMFQHGQTGLGVACIILAFCGIGWFIVLVYGWMKADQWKIKNLMMAYTVSFLLAILLGAITGPPVQVG